MRGVHGEKEGRKSVRTVGKRELWRERESELWGEEGKRVRPGGGGEEKKRKVGGRKPRLGFLGFA